MFENNLNERLTRIQNITMKASQDLIKSVGVNYKRLSDANSMLANNIAKKAQLKSVEMLAIKTPEELSTLFHLDNSNEFMHEMINYQGEVKKIMKETSQEMTDSMHKIYEDAKNGLDEMFNVICANAPNGSDVLIRPHQSAFQSFFRGIKQLNEYSENIFESLENLSKAAEKSIVDTGIATKTHRKHRS
jgi:hypothetical protein